MDSSSLASVASPAETNEALEPDFQRLRGILLSSQRFNERALHASFEGLPTREFRLLMWKVRESLREDRGIEFRPTQTRDGTYERATAAQKLARGARFNRTGIRKQRRALDIVRAADELELDDAGRRRKESAEHRIEQSIVFARARRRPDS